MDEMN